MSKYFLFSIISKEYRHPLNHGYGTSHQKASRQKASRLNGAEGVLEFQPQGGSLLDGAFGGRGAAPDGDPPGGDLGGGVRPKMTPAKELGGVTNSPLLNNGAGSSDDQSQIVGH